MCNHEFDKALQLFANTLSTGCHDPLIVANLDLCLDLTQIQTLLAQLGVSLDFGGIELFGDNPRIFELR